MSPASSTAVDAGIVTPEKGMQSEASATDPATGSDGAGGAIDNSPPAPSSTSECTIGPGPSFEAVLALGMDVTPYTNATIRICRNESSCDKGTFMLPVDFLVGAGWGAAGTYSATIWNEGGDGFVLDATYHSPTPVANGDTYTVVVTPGDGGGPIVNFSATVAAYSHIDNCAGGYLYARAGVPCTQTSAAPDCLDNWDDQLCKCRAR